MTENLKESINTYVKTNKGQSYASNVSQSQLSMLGDSYGGRFDFGKLYFFQYFTPDEPWYDTNPIVLGLGPSDNNNELGINLHYMPFKVRVQLLNKIWTSFSGTIKKQINGPNSGKPVNQSALPGFNWNNLKAAYGPNFNLEHCIKQYRLDRMRSMKILGYENWYIATTNDVDRFHNISIGAVQSMYYRDI